jgi:hypothetical protein
MLPTLYGASPGALSVAETGELQFRSTCTSDHVATPSFDVVPLSRAEYSWMRLCLRCPEGVTPAKLRTVFQTEGNEAVCLPSRVTIEHGFESKTHSNLEHDLPRRQETL